MATDKDSLVDAHEDEPAWDPMHYGHPRMPLDERAKIFMPFDPLKGFREELRRRELLVQERQTHSPWLPEEDLPPEDLTSW